MDISSKSEIAERHLAGLQTFYPRVDARVSTIFAISSAQTAIAAFNYVGPQQASVWQSLLLILFGLSTVIIHVNLYMCTFPKLTGGSETSMFFAHVAKMGEADFIAKYRTLSEDEIFADLTKQIWRSSQILADKYRHLTNGTIALAAASVAWVLFLVLVSAGTGKFPALSAS